MISATLLALALAQLPALPAHPDEPLVQRRVVLSVLDEGGLPQVFESQDAYLPVTRTVAPRTDLLVRLEVGSSTIYGTADHEVYLATSQSWAPLASLHPGDLVSPPGRGLAEVHTRTLVPVPQQRVYNLVVAGGGQNFYVQGARDGLAFLVHNGDTCPPGTPTLADSATPTTGALDELPAHAADGVPLNIRPDVFLDELMDGGVLDSVGDGAELVARLRGLAPGAVRRHAGTGSFAGRVEFVEVRLSLGRGSAPGSDLWFMRLDGDWYYGRVLRGKGETALFPRWEPVDPDRYISY